jgi:hypothetical protein
VGDEGDACFVCVCFLGVGGWGCVFVDVSE